MKTPGNAELQLRIAPIVAICLLFAILLNCNSIVAQNEDQDRAKTQTDEQIKFSDTDIEFFENKVRPLLIEHCLECHGNDEKKIRGELRLTSRAKILKGGDSGPAIVPGKPDESLLIGSIRYEDFEMPPAGQLKEPDIQILTKWIEMGAPDPRKIGKVTLPNAIDIDRGKKFWAFKAPRIVPPTQTKNESWPNSRIDQYILSRLEQEGIEPAAQAGRETLIRRAYIALIGLPPTVDEIDTFVNDNSELQDAFTKVIDRLLNSRHFGERWGRHWLDVVRFAESSGGGRSLMFPDAWRFRDYVIDSYNADKPFDQFIKEQIAGDLLPYESHDQKTEQIIATGMLALGPTNYEQQDKELLRMEVIDEQVDTVGRAFMGLTLGCARCHDHKFDPIPMSDYYAMAGIFGATQSLVDGNVSKYVLQPLATEKELLIEKEFRQKVSVLSKQLADAKLQLKRLDGSPVQGNTQQKSRKSKNLPGVVIDDRSAKLTGKWIESTSVPFFVDGHYLHDEHSDKGKKMAVFTPELKSGGRYEVRLAYSAGGNRASNVPVAIDHQDGQTIVVVNQSQEPPIDGLFISLGVYRFEADNKSAVTISTKETDGHVIVDAVQLLSQNETAKRKSVEKKHRSDNDSGKSLSKEEAGGIGAVVPTKEIEDLRRLIKSLDEQLKELKKNAPGPVAFAMSVKDANEPADGHIHIRGSVRNLGPVVPRGFISVCCSDNHQPDLAAQQSGRLQLAQWIASPDHPLTSKVYVNRVWRHLFGFGLVSTTDNFGLMGQRPSHPELLDYLASQFVLNGWSTKKLIREIMMSRVYQLSATEMSVGRDRDKSNRLLWRANRRRVDAEVLRDSILFVSGDLDLKPGGLTIRKLSEYDLGYEFETVRRSVYVPAFRNSMLDVFEVFDFANPNLVIGHRNTSTLPTQSLFLMNSPLVIQQSRKAASRLLANKNLDDLERIELAYRRALGRRPTKVEFRNAVEYLDSFVSESNVEDPKLAGWTSLCHALFASIDFRYVD